MCSYIGHFMRFMCKEQKKKKKEKKVLVSNEQIYRNAKLQLS